MKTLKQLIREQYQNENQYNVFHNLVQEEKEINAFKEWLTQKRKEKLTIDFKLLENGIVSKTMTTKIELIDEFLEELAQ